MSSRCCGALTTDASQREIGASLYLSINTVKGYTKAFYTKAFYRKLGVDSRSDAVVRVRELGLYLNLVKGIAWGLAHRSFRNNKRCCT